MCCIRPNHSIYHHFTKQNQSWQAEKFRDLGCHVIGTASSSVIGQRRRHTGWHLIQQLYACKTMHVSQPDCVWCSCQLYSSASNCDMKVICDMIWKHSLCQVPCEMCCWVSWGVSVRQLPTTHILSGKHKYFSQFVMYKCKTIAVQSNNSCSRSQKYIAPHVGTNPRPLD